MLLKERSDFCNVDTAYEAVDGLDLTDPTKQKRNSLLKSPTGETSYDGLYFVINQFISDQFLISLYKT